MEEISVKISQDQDNNELVILDKNRVKLPKLSAAEMITNFGIKSEHYKWSLNQIRELYHKLESHRESSLNHLFKEWESIYSRIYEKSPSLEIFLNQVYLTVIAKATLFLKFSTKDAVDIINWPSFDKNTIDFTGWMTDEKIVNNAIVLFQKTAKILSNYDLAIIEEDVFRALYEEIIEGAQRHKLGEYYTPKWLVGLVLKEALSLWDRNFPPKIFDPACGSGTFLVYAALYLKEKYKLPANALVEYIAGLDINPIAVIVAKTNLAVVLDDPNLSRFQIYNRDALKNYDLFDSNTDVSRYNVIVGNPPWIVLRSIKNKNYQNFVKKEMIKYKLITNGDVHLYTQLDTSALFFNKCTDRYLNKNGIIAFVMPRSVIGGTHQHKNFRKFKYPSTRLIKVIDLEEVNPLFNMPSCVLIGRKGDRNVYPVPLDKYRGELPDRDLDFQNAKSILCLQSDKYIPKINGEKKSYYYNKFKVGLSIFPRSFYFLDLERINDKIVSVKTSKEVLRIVKEPWKHELTGAIEKDFIFCTILPCKMVPFGYMEVHPVVLPIRRNDKYELLDFNDMKQMGCNGLYKWFKNAQRIWDNYKTEKAKERFPRLLDRLNYNNLIEFQHPGNKYVVLYNATGKNITSCVIDKRYLPEFMVNSKNLHPKGFIADVKTWLFETNSENEAYYLATILNSALLNMLIKPFQPRGLYGARAIHRRPLEFPISKFDDKNGTHAEVALLGKNLHSKVQNLIQKNISKSQIRKYIQNDLSKINMLMKNLFRIEEVS